MKIYEAIKEILNDNSKTFKSVTKPYLIKISSTGGLSVVKTVGKVLKTNALDITGEHVLLEWEEARRPVTSTEAFKQTKRIRPVGSDKFEDVTEWLLRLCDVDKRHLFNSLWEIE
jgi:hypothetical protein